MLVLCLLEYLKLNSRRDRGVSHFFNNKADIPKDLKEVDLVIYGHSHKFSNERIDNIVYLNYMI